jgi:hypothetical protein
MRGVSLAVVLALGGWAQASYIVLPPGAAGAPGFVGLNSPLRSQARTIQQVLPGGALAPGGTAIQGFTFRAALPAINPGVTSWPASPIQFAGYEVRIGVWAGVHGTPLSGTFADNIVPGTDTLVRSGGLAIPAGAFVAGSPTVPAPWGAVDVVLDTPFVFNPTLDYVMTIRHTGSGAGTDFFMDTSEPAGAYQGAVVGTSATATSGLDSGSYIDLRVNVIPAPAGAALLGIGGLGVLARRRRPQ